MVLTYWCAHKLMFDMIIIITTKFVDEAHCFNF